MGYHLCKEMCTKPTDPLVESREGEVRGRGGMPGGTNGLWHFFSLHRIEIKLLSTRLDIHVHVHVWLSFSSFLSPSFFHL